MAVLSSTPIQVVAHYLVKFILVYSVAATLKNYKNILFECACPGLSKIYCWHLWETQDYDFSSATYILALLRSVV